MILHDVCSIKFTEKLDSLDNTTPRVVSFGQAPCEINPLKSELTGGELVVTYYLWVTTFDMLTAIDAQVADWKASYAGSKGLALTITYRGKSLTPEAGFEVHRVLGRFHHIEAVIRDFGFTGA